MDLKNINMDSQKLKNIIGAIEKVVKLIKNARKDDKYTILVTLDIEGAFDNAWWPQIINETRRKGVCDKLLTILHTDEWT